MAEMKVRNLAMVGCLVVVVGAIALTLMGVIGYGWFNKDTLWGIFDKGVATATGYGPAKTPVEAMDYFHKAIQDRKYNVAANYTTNDYAAQLKRAHPGASAIGAHADSIRAFATEKGFMSDRLKYALNQLDPFPKNFKTGPAPAVVGDKATGTYIWEPLKFDTANPLALGVEGTFKEFDQRMFQTLLFQPVAPLAKIDLVKEGDEWKLNIPSNPVFEANVTYFMDKQKSYNTALNGFVTDMNRLRNVTKAQFEDEVFKVLRESK